MKYIKCLKIIFALLLISFAGLTPAIAEQAKSVSGSRANTVDHRNKNVIDHRKPRKTNVRDHRRTSNTTVRDHRNNRVTANPLTRKDCRALGGKEVSLNYCSVGGKACQTTDQSGTVHHVCLKLYSPGNAGKKKSEKTSKPYHANTAFSVTGKLKAVSLTSQECRGLGGTVSTTNKCNANDQKACVTVDKHGVVRAACIDKVIN